MHLFYIKMTLTQSNLFASTVMNWLVILCNLHKIEETLLNMMKI
jgi:hypothetical protein